MSFITNALLGQGSNNAGFVASGAGGVPTSATLNPTTAAQAGQTFNQAQNGLAQQQALISALQAGGNQGISNQSTLANALMSQAMGTGGPSPAQAMLSQATGQNVANTAATMAGARGAGSNIGLMARQVGQQGAATQQNAVGQAATLKAQEQLAAQNALSNLSGTQIGQSTGAVNAYNQAAQNEQGNILSGVNAQNNANTAMQSNINSANAAMSQTNANNSAGMLGGLINSVGGALAGPVKSMFSGAHGGIVTKENPKVAQVPQKDRFQMPDHIQTMANIFHKNYAWGGNVTNVGQLSDYSPSSKVVNSSPSSLDQTFNIKDQEQKTPPSKLKNPPNLGVDTNLNMQVPNVPGAVGQVPAVNLTTPALGSSAMAQTTPSLMNTNMGFDEGGEVPAENYSDKGIDTETGHGTVTNQGSPAENSAGGSGSAASSLSHAFDFLNPSSGGSGGGGGSSMMSMLPMLAMAAEHGALVPGEAEVDGDSSKNDTIPAMLSPGEAVIPRSIMQSDDPVAGAAKFVAALVKDHDKKHGKETSDFKKALAQAIKSRKK